MSTKRLNNFLQLELVFLIASLIILLLDFLGLNSLPQYTSPSFLDPLILVILQIVLLVVLAAGIYNKRFGPTAITAILLMITGLLVGFITGILVFLFGLLILLDLYVF